MYILDTNVLSELRRAASGRADLRVLDWAGRVASDQLHLSAITAMEVELGILLIERRDPVQAALLRSWMQAKVLDAFSGRILPVDSSVARRCAALHVPNPRPDRDALIGATALVHGMTVVTRDVSDFQGMGVSLLNPWAQQPAPR